MADPRKMMLKRTPLLLAMPPLDPVLAFDAVPGPEGIHMKYYRVATAIRQLETDLALLEIDGDVMTPEQVNGTNTAFAKLIKATK